MVAVIIAAIVITPIYFNAEHFPFYWTNGIFVFAFITYTRLMFFINSSMLTLHVSVKLFFLATAVPFTFLLIDMFNDFQVYLDNNGTKPFFGHLLDQKQISMEIYLRNEILLFGVGGSLAASADRVVVGAGDGRAGDREDRVHVRGSCARGDPQLQR